MRAFRVTRTLHFAARDLREKLLLERERRKEALKPVIQQRTALGEASPHKEEIDDNELARRLGFLPPESVDLNQLLAERTRLEALIVQQRAKARANKEAFYEWQAGQREKGLATRTFRQAVKAERTKRCHAVTAGQRLISVAYHPELGDNSNNELNAVTTERMLPRRLLQKSSSFINAVRRQRT